MNTSSGDRTAPSGRVPIWIGRVISLIVAALFIMSAVMKWRGGPELDEGFKHLELSPSLAVPLAVLEAICAILYLIPVTSVTGAILLTGYLGGAICTHLRVNDPIFIQIVVGIVVWIGIYLREPRLRSLAPFRIVHD